MNDLVETCVNFVEQIAQELDLFQSGLNYTFLINKQAWFALVRKDMKYPLNLHNFTICGHPCKQCESSVPIRLSISPNECKFDFCPFYYQAEDGSMKKMCHNPMGRCDGKAVD